MTSTKPLYVSSLLAGLLLATAAPTARAEDGMTLAALRVAYQREVSAQQHDAAFSARAEQEGCIDAAILFRALAAAERIHAAHFGRALEALGSTPVAQPGPTVLRSTAENLRVAIAAEVLERGTAYPRFIEYARAECLYDALAALCYARDAEASHERLLAAALAGAGGHGAGFTCVVCPDCGAVQPGRAPHPCRCGASASHGLAFEASSLAPRPEPLIARR